MDLFTAFTDTPEQARERHFEEMLGDAMKKQWDEDQATVKARGDIPDWIGEPSPLSRDKARLLELLFEVGAVRWSSHISKNNQDVTKAMGLNSVANAKAVLDMCCKEGLVTSRLYRNERIFELSQMGEFSLEEHQIEVELGLI